MLQGSLLISGGVGSIGELVAAAEIHLPGLPCAVPCPGQFPSPLDDRIGTPSFCLNTISMGPAIR